MSVRITTAANDADDEGRESAGAGARSIAGANAVRRGSARGNLNGLPAFAGGQKVLRVCLVIGFEHVFKSCRDRQFKSSHLCFQGVNGVLVQRGRGVCNVGVLARAASSLRHRLIGEPLSIRVVGIALDLAQGTVTRKRHQLRAWCRRPRQSGNFRLAERATGPSREARKEN
jgi:hypothetical protein